MTLNDVTLPAPAVITQCITRLYHWLYIGKESLCTLTYLEIKISNHNINICLIHYILYCFQGVKYSLQLKILIALILYAYELFCF